MTIKTFYNIFKQLSHISQCSITDLTTVNDNKKITDRLCDSTAYILAS